MRILTGARCVTDNVHVKENEALEICTPAVMAVDCSRGLVSGMIRGALHEAMLNLAGHCGINRVLMFKTGPADNWVTLKGDELEKGISNLAKRIGDTKDGELYITLPNCTHVEIYKIEEV